MADRFAPHSMLTAVDLLLAQTRQPVSQLLQLPQVADHPSNHTLSLLHASIRSRKSTSGRVENGDDSQTLRQRAGFCDRQHMQSSHNLHCERHGQFTQRVSAILPADLGVQHVLDAVLFADQVVQRASATRNEQCFTVQRGEKNNAFLRFLTFCNFERSCRQPICLSPQAPDCICRSSSGQCPDPHDPKRKNSDYDCGPSSARSQGVPPDDAVIYAQLIAAKNPTPCAHSFDPLSTAKHSATAQSVRAATVTLATVKPPRELRTRLRENV